MTRLEILERILSLDLRHLSQEEKEWLHELRNQATRENIRHYIKNKKKETAQ